MILESNEATFDIDTHAGVVLVDFYTPSCGPCRMMNPILAQLEDVKIVKVDVSENYELASRFNFNTVPTLIFLKDGVEEHRLKGVQSKEDLQAKIDQLNE